MTEQQRATSLGATGGLPGANAAPQASELTPDELDDTVATGDVVTTPVDPDREVDVDTAVSGPEHRESSEAGATSEPFGNLSVEDDAEGTVNPADLAGTGGPQDDAVDG